MTADPEPSGGNDGPCRFRAWLQRYVDAWRLNDPVAVGDLFSPDVRYAFDPFGEAIVGRNAVIEAWLDDP